MIPVILGSAYKMIWMRASVGHSCSSTDVRPLSNCSPANITGAISCMNPNVPSALT